MFGSFHLRSASALSYAVLLAGSTLMIAFGEGTRVGPKGLVRLGVGVDLRTLGMLGVVLALGLLLRRASAAPRIVPRPKGLHACTAPLAVGLTLGGWKRELIVDGRAGRIYLRRRAAWLWSTDEQLRFSEVDHVDYGHRGGESALETYDVSLVLRDGSRRSLFSFRGEVAEGAGSSVEEGRSRTFVRLLTATIGVGLGPRTRHG